jgi:hypothetical protein
MTVLRADGWRRLGRVALVGITLTALPAGSATAAATAPSSPSPKGGAPEPEVPEAIEPPGLPAGALAAWQPAANDPAEVAALKERVVRGGEGARLLKEVLKLSHKYPRNDELPYLLGQMYFSKLWVGDGLKAFRSAIQLNPEYRSNPFLLRAVITGLGNDSDHGQVRRFLTQDIGLPAAPYLEEVLYSDWRAQVKERAAAVLRELQ